MNKPTTIVFLSTAWSARAGGINCFNMDLVKAVARQSATDLHVICVVPRGTSQAGDSGRVSALKEQSLLVIDLGLDSDDRFDPGWVGSMLTALRNNGIVRVDWWVGHDVISGEAANRARDESRQGQSAVFMHMSYRDYQVVKHASAGEAQSKIETQRKIFASATRVYAVGPLLARRAAEYTVGQSVKMIVPGLAEKIPENRSPRDRVVAISFGRFEQQNDRVKQISLVVAAFAHACHQARAVQGMTPLLRGNDAALTLLGVSTKEEETKLSDLAQRYGKRAILLSSLPFEESREKLFQHISTSNLALMLSWHEGFGLTAWEAISCEVPVVMSTDSGAYQYLRDIGLGNSVRSVTIDGFLNSSGTESALPFTDSDLNSVAGQILEFGSSLDVELRTARELKRSLVANGISWDATGREFLQGLELEDFGISGRHRQSLNGDHLNPSDPSASGSEVVAESSLSHGEVIHSMSQSKPEADTVPSGSKIDRAVRFRPQFVSFLDEPGIALEHPTRGRPSLADLYVVPDLQVLNRLGDSRASVTILPSERVVDDITGSSEVLIVGDTQSGKTALAKKLIAEFYERGLTPIYLSSIRSPVFGSELDKALQKAISEQYEGNSVQIYEAHSPREKRVIIVDDFHLVLGKFAHRRKFQREIRQRAERVVYLAHNIAISHEDLLGIAEEVETKRLQVLPLGFARRAELIEKWASLGVDDNERKIARTVLETTKLVDSIIGKNFVPSFPPYVLALIQAQSAATVVDTSAGTHGYFYELLIRNSLARESTTDEYDVTMAYLANLAATMLSASRRSLSSAEARDAHDDFERRIDLTLNFDNIVGRLERRNIIALRGGSVEFRYSYFFYYFAALSLRDSISSERTQAHIKRFASSLHIEESANVLLFLAHLTRDSFVVETLLAASSAAFAEAPMASLMPEDYSSPELARLESITSIFTDDDPEETRKRVFAEMDDAQREAEIESDRLAAQEPTAEMIRIGQALAVLQILGQVVKNFPGTLEADRKTRIVAECYGLGRRILGWYLGVLKDNRVGIIADAAQIIKRDHPSFSLEKVVRKAEVLVGTLVASATFGIVKRVSVAVGSRHLERTYRRVYDSSLPVVQLFDFSIRLDHVGEFPLAELKNVAASVKDGRLPMFVLRALVTQYLHVFPVDFRDKQAACACLGMKYERRDLLLEDRKLLPGGKK